MKTVIVRVVCGLLILGAAVGATAFRLPRIAQRPMHTDEAVQADKFGELLETGRYVYNPVEYHGPTLYYLTLPSTWVRGQHSYVDTDERTYRIVPVVFGVALVVLLLVVMDGLSAPAAVGAGVFTAISPAMVFYSRYYIQEMLLVFFTFGAIAMGWRYARSRRAAWAILTGAFLGLMHATKETDIIALASLAVALAVVLAWRWIEGGDLEGPPPERPVRAWHLLAVVLAGAAVTVVFFSSFFTHWRGPWDSILTYGNYFTKAGANEVHRHPWDYYLRILLYWKDEPTKSCPVWSEAIIVALAGVGFVAAVLRKGLGRGNPWFIRFVAVYTVVLTVAYSTIPYKTPWCMLGFLHGMILLAGVGAIALLRILPLEWVGGGLGALGDFAGAALAKLTLLLVLAGASYNLAMQTYRASFLYYADPRNPYVYGHALPDVIRLARRVADIAEYCPKDCEPQIQVIAPSHYPLPWYLRRFHVGYYRQVPPHVVAPIIIVGQPDEDDPDRSYGLEKQLWQTYDMEYYGLRVRPSVFLQLYVRKDLWDRFMADRAKVRIPPPPRGQ